MIKTAVIGVGRMGSNHVRCLSEMPEAALAAIADPDEARAKELAERFGCPAFADYLEMLACVQPHAVIAAVPTLLHSDVAHDVIRQGCHLLLEKPLAESPAAARQIVEVAQKRGVRLAVGHIERFNPAVRKLKEIIDAGTLGDILSVSARRVGLPSPHLNDTNVVLDLAVHDLDVLRFLLPAEPEVVSSVTGRFIGGPREDYADILLLAGNVPCVVQVNWVTPVKVRNLSVVGSAGYAELNYMTQTLHLYRRQPLVPVDTYEELIARYGTAEREVVHAGGEEPLRAELRAFFTSILNGGEMEASGEDGLKAVELAHEILRCAVQVQAPSDQARASRTAHGR